MATGMKRYFIVEKVSEDLTPTATWTRSLSAGRGFRKCLLSCGAQQMSDEMNHCGGVLLQDIAVSVELWCWNILNYGKVERVGVFIQVSTLHYSWCFVSSCVYWTEKLAFGVMETDFEDFQSIFSDDWRRWREQQKEFAWNSSSSYLFCL